MWKKSDTEEYDSQPIHESQTSSVSKPEVPASKNRGLATIGSTVSVKGDLVGEEDLLIEGKLEGKIECHRHGVTIGRNGHIKGDIFGKIITVEGKVEGNLYGDEQLRILNSGTVRGNIVAPRVALEEGANFKGSIDMSPKEKSPAVFKKTEAAATVPATMN